MIQNFKDFEGRREPGRRRRVGDPAGAL